MSAYSAAVLADSPNGYWRLGESAGTTAASQVNSPTIDGTYNGSPSLGQAGALAGDADTAVKLVRASSQYVALGTAPALLQVGDVLSIEAWVKRQSVTSTTQYIFYLGTGSAAFRFDVTTNLLHVDKAGIAGIVSSTVAVTDTTTWHHVVYTKSGATNNLYLDGVDVTGTVANATMVNTSHDCFIGTDSSNHFDGYMDEVAFYPTALSAARVTAHYQAATSSGGATSGPAAVGAPTPFPIFF